MGLDTQEEDVRPYEREMWKPCCEKDLEGKGRKNFCDLGD